jgi:hypothetical protein
MKLFDAFWKWKVMIEKETEKKENLLHTDKWNGILFK